MFERFDFDCPTEENPTPSGRVDVNEMFNTHGDVLDAEVAVELYPLLFQYPNDTEEDS